MSSPTWGCSADKKMSSPATLQMPELWVYSVSHAARLHIFVYCSCYPWRGFRAGEGRILPGSRLPRDSKKYLALNSSSSVVQRTPYPFPRPPAHGSVGVSGPRRTVESTSTSWSLFSKPFPSEILSFWETSLSGSHFRQKSNPQRSTQTGSLQSPSAGLQELPFGREVRKRSVNIWCSKRLAWGLCADVRSHRPRGLAPEYLLLIFFSRD